MGKLIQALDANLNSTTYEYDKLKRLTTVHHPSGPTSSYTYYNDGVLLTKTDGKGQTITFVYDRLKRLKEKQYPNGQKIIYSYSGENLGSVQDQVVSETTNFSYDSSYRLSSIVNPRGTISYGYTADDQLQTYQVNSDPSVGFAYYDDGSVKTITRTGDNPLTYYYLLTGQKSQVVYPNNASVSLSYDDQGRLTGIINRKPDSSILSSYTYGYDYNQATGSYSMKGSRTSMTDQSAQQEKYYFDNLYQLTRVDYGNGDMHQWSYDDIGNRVQQTVTPAGQGPIVTNYTYYQNSQSRNSRLLASDGTNAYTWDNNGNLLTKGSTNYTWDYDDRLTGISGGSVTASYNYDYLGKRIKKTVGSVETAYLYRAEDIIKETSGGTVTDYLHGKGIDDPVMLDRSGAKSYYFGDGLGSIREVTDTTGTVQNSYSYGAWGELRASSATIANSYGYIGREFAEEGLSFYRARYLDPGLGRFLSEDPAQIMIDQNVYRYVNNNPANYSDSSGLDAPLTPEEEKDCQAKIMEALNLVSKWSKKQCCIKEFSQWGCSISELLADHQRAVKTGDGEKCAPFVSEDGKERKAQWLGYIHEKGDDSIYICPFSCRWSFEPATFIAKVIVHELMHLCQRTSDIWLDYISDVDWWDVPLWEEDYANQASHTCSSNKKGP